MFKNELSITPTLSGCYIMKDKNNNIIYVGKAKNLKKRLSSYFNKIHTGKTYNLVQNIDNFEYIVTNSEKEALLLEISLIKKHNPKYNIMLKDDKSYPFIELTLEKYPRLKIIRRININKNNHKRLFGPYPSSFAARKVVELLNRIYPLRKCNNMGKEVCLYYHLNQCLGYCTNNINTEKIDSYTHKIIDFLNGNYNEVIKKLEDDLKVSIDTLNFEKSIEIKELLEYINNVLNKQKIEFLDNVDRDVFGYYIDKGYISIQVFFIRSGKLVERESEILEVNDNVEEMLEEYVVRFYEKNNLVPKEIILPSLLNPEKEILNEVLNTKIIIPIKGNKMSILNLAIKNAKIGLEDKFELIKRNEEKTSHANKELSKILGIEEINRIEIFDTSNIFGNFNVSGMVVFTNGVPNKNEYRKFKISVDKNDDYNSMKEVIYRRYFKVLKDNLVKPELIIVDGGKNQINAAKEVIDSLNLNIKICGLVKNNKHRTSNLMDENFNIIEINKDSNLFYLLTRIQDEVHNFTINYHRDIRSKGMISSILDNIEGVGEERKKLLIKRFNNIDNIKLASIEELSKVVPNNIANNIYNYFINKK